MSQSRESAAPALDYFVLMHQPAVLVPDADCLSQATHETHLRVSDQYHSHT